MSRVKTVIIGIFCFTMGLIIPVTFSASAETTPLVNSGDFSSDGKIVIDNKTVFDSADFSFLASKLNGLNETVGQNSLGISEINDSLHALKSYEVEEKRSNIPLSIGGRGYVNITIDITKDGYTPILVSPKGTNHVDCVIVGIITTSSPATITVYNLASSAQTVTAVIYVLYEKNP